MWTMDALPASAGITASSLRAAFLAAAARRARFFWFLFCFLFLAMVGSRLQSKFAGYSSEVDTNEKLLLMSHRRPVSSQFAAHLFLKKYTDAYQGTG
jgi:hypothetical protein